MMLWFLPILLTFAASHFSTKRITLTGPWVLKGDTQSTVYINDGGMDSYSSLWITKLTSDPLLDDNDVKLAAIGTRNWTFTHAFCPSLHYMFHTWTELFWDGIDLFCDVRLNNILIGKSENSFLMYSWELTEVLIPGQENKLELICNSTVLMAAAIAEERSRSKLIAAPPDCWPSIYNGQCHINLVRTTQAAFGWDWGPSFPIQGFWNTPKIIFSHFNLRFGEGFKWFTHLAESDHGRYLRWSATATIEVVRPYPDTEADMEDYCVHFTLNSANIPTNYKCFPLRTDRKTQDITIQVFYDQCDLILWWPNGISTGPYVYRLFVLLSTRNGILVDEMVRQVGIREVKLIEKPIRSAEPGLGLSFYFQVNGVPVFAKGTNWIPARLFPGRGVGFMRNRNEDRFWAEKRILRSAAMAGTNLIRVWGGGRYEPEEFYNEADRLGLMVWHDLMFAVSTYPSTEKPDPLSTVEQEVRSRIRMLHSHPSIVVWATDNEVKQAIFSSWYHVNEPRLFDAYEKRFIDSIHRIAMEEEAFPSAATIDDTYYRRCLISSPNNGILSETKQDLRRNPQDTKHGDVHLYVYDGNTWSEDAYLVTRFTSEFGLQSLPSSLAWSRSLSNPNQMDFWDVMGPLMKHRQHSSLGMSILDTAASFVGKPDENVDMIERYERWAYVTQLHQMMSYRAHINRLMRHQCQLVNGDDKIEARSSMGAAYWQLNDIWSAPTWSTIDSAGQWKMAHYGAIRVCYQPNTLGRIAAHVISGSLEAHWIPPVQIENLIEIPDYITVRCSTVHSFDASGQWIISQPKNRRLNASCPQLVLRENLQPILERCNFANSNQSGRLIQFKIAHNSPDNDEDSFVLLDAVPSIDWDHANRKGITIKSINEAPITGNAPFVPSHAFCLTLSSERPELFVWLTLNYQLDVEYWFNKNAFSFIENDTKTVHLYIATDRQVNLDDISRSLHIHTLANIKEGR